MLTDIEIRNAKPRAVPYKLAAGEAMHLFVKPNGSKLWRFKYRFGGKEKLLSIGIYPDVTLRMAHDAREAARRQLASGVDPGEAKRSQQTLAAETFESIAREWFAKFSPNWAKGHADKIIRRLELNLFPWVGTKPIATITSLQVLTCLRRIEARGCKETAHRAHQNCGQVFRYAVATGRAERDPAADLRGALAPVKQDHYATIVEPAKVGALMRAIDGYTGTFIGRTALRLAPLVFVRPGELRKAEWSEINVESAEWRIPAHRMKARVLHIVPLATQAVQLLSEIQPLTGDGRFVFPSEFSRSKSMSENTINSALRRLGYSSSQMTGHSFRSMASTLLNEQGWNRDAIERQLAHGDRDRVRAAYNYAQHLPERRKMMQAWADYLDKLRMGAPVVNLKLAG